MCRMIHNVTILHNDGFMFTGEHLLKCPLHDWLKTSALTKKHCDEVKQQKAWVSWMSAPKTIEVIGRLVFLTTKSHKYMVRYYLDSKHFSKPAFS